MKPSLRIILGSIFLTLLAGGCVVDQRSPEATLAPEVERRGLSTPQVETAPTIEEPLVLDIVSGSPTIDARLEGLSLEAFFEESYKQLLLRNPQRITELGLAREYGLRNDQLNNLSEVYLNETVKMAASILDLLRQFKRTALKPEEQLSVDIYAWWLDDQIRGHEFMYYNYPVHHFLNSYDDELIRLFTEIHPLETKDDAEDYISRLAQVDDQVGQLKQGLIKREEIGVIPPKFILEMTTGNLYSYLRMRSPDLSSIDAESLSVYEVFKTGVERMDHLSDVEKQTLLDTALFEVETSFVSAFVELINYVEQLKSKATNDAGVWKFPNGVAYYAYILRNQTSTDLTPQEIHDLGKAEVARIQGEMRAIFDELGYPSGAGLGELMSRAIGEGGYYEVSTQAGKDNVLDVYKEILDEVDQRLSAVVDLRPSAEVIIVGEPSFGGGGFYVSPTLDGSRPGAFHTGVGGSRVYKFNMPTVAYHEAIPGHHFQIAIAQEMDLPLFRRDVFFNGFVEGWALYAERLAWELGLYEQDPYGNLGRLQLELLRAVRLVTDTGIHAMRWTREQAKTYMRDSLGDPSGRWEHEVDRYIVFPAQATGYKIGMLKILELRQMAKDQLGDQFDIKQFHNLVLGNGNVPLEILERIVEDDIQKTLANTKLDRF